jgi:hypothetical protein
MQTRVASSPGIMLALTWKSDSSEPRTDGNESGLKPGDNAGSNVEERPFRAAYPDPNERGFSPRRMT